MALYRARFHHRRPRQVNEEFPRSYRIRNQPRLGEFSLEDLILSSGGS